MGLGRILACVVRKQPHLPELLVISGVSCCQIIRAPIDYELGGLVFARHPEILSDQLVTDVTTLVKSATGDKRVAFQRPPGFTIPYRTEPGALENAHL